MSATHGASDPVDASKIEPAAPIPEPVQELDVWWGSYSGWTMLPSLALCIGLTALLAWGAWQLLDKGWVRFTIMALASTLWLLQAMRWCYCVFGYNYRFTTHRLFQTRGLFRPDVEISLARVTKVAVRRGPHDVLAGVGDLLITLDGATRPQVMLDGVARPLQVAEHLRQVCARARSLAATGSAKAAVDSASMQK